MIKVFIKRLITINKEFILSELRGIKGFMQLLMKHRNTGLKWTSEEIAEIRLHLRNISKLVPALIVFLLPGGALLLPLLAEVLDRRKKARLV
ncbi:MAG: hypothetical protein AABY42_02095 [Nitrospirota bacterium]